MGETIRPDVLIHIVYQFGDTANEAKIFTNARDDGAIEEILSDWVEDQIMRGKKPEDPVCAAEEVKSPVEIKIGLKIGDPDEWGFESTSGSRAMDVGIVVDVLSRLATISKEGLKP